MMGVQETPARLFYDFCLDERVPFDHLLRSIDPHLDLANLRRSLKPFYSQRSLRRMRFAPHANISPRSTWATQKCPTRG